ncbi:hypothetical protein [Microbacterium maritypicum]
MTRITISRGALSMKARIVTKAGVESTIAVGSIRIAVAMTASAVKMETKMRAPCHDSKALSSSERYKLICGPITRRI